MTLQVGGSVLFLLSDSRLGSNEFLRLLELLLQHLDFILVLLDKGKDDAVVDGEAALGRRVEEPDERGDFEHVVEGDHSEDEAGELVRDGEKSEGDPVGQPHLVVIGSLRLQSHEGHEAGVGNANDIGEERAANTKDDEHNQESHSTLEHGFLGHTSSLSCFFDELHIAKDY